MQINILNGYDIAKISISDSGDGSVRIISLSELEVRAALNEYQEIDSLTLLHNDELVVELTQVGYYDEVWTSDTITKMGQIIGYVIANNGKTNFTNNEVVSSLTDNTPYTVYTIPEDNMYIYYDEGFNPIPKVSNGSWKTNGNAGTNYEDNFIGTTDEMPLVIRANNTPLAVIYEGGLSMGSSNVYNSPTTGYTINASTTSVSTGIYDSGDLMLESKTDYDGFSIRKGSSDIFYVNQSSGYTGIGYNNNEPSVTLDVLGDVLVWNGSDATITARAAKNALFISQNDPASQYYYSGFKSIGEDAYLQMGMTGTDWGNDTYGIPELNNVGYIRASGTDLVLDSSNEVVIYSKGKATIKVAEGVTINPNEHVVASTPISNVQINQTDNVAQNGLRFVSSETPATNWDIGINIDENLALDYRGDTLGVFNNGTGIYTTISDERLKQNIVPLTDEDLLLQLNPKQFTFKNDESNTKRYGLIAQEVRTIIPELVTGDETKGNLTVDYTSLIPLLIKQIQVLTDKVNSLTN